MSTEDSDEKLARVGTFLAKSLVGLLPGGGVASEIVSLLIGDPGARRRDRFLAEIVERLERLESIGRINLSEMAEDDRVGAILLQAIQIAAKSYGERKLASLRACALAGACIESHRALSSVVLGVVDEMTDLHLYILHEIKRASKRYAMRDLSESTIYHHMLSRSYGVDHPITVGFAETHRKIAGIPDPDESDYGIVFDRIVRSGLLDTDEVSEDFGAEKDRVKRNYSISQLGELVLRQIDEGQGLETAYKAAS